MATIVNTILGQGSGLPITLQRATPELYRAGLGLLLVGKPRPNDPAVDQFLIFASQQKMAVEELWVALRGNEPIASVLLIPSPGRTAIVFLSPTIGPGGSAIEAQLTRRTCDAQDSRRLRLIQAILDTGQDAHTHALTQAGFKHLAQLVYMQRSTERGHETLQLDPGMEVFRWNEANRPAFSSGILSSYEETRDCPALLGLRDINDIIAGHMGSGKFEPELWLAVRQGGETLAVMLINLVPQRRAAELVYLGLNRACRGRGLGRKLLTHGLSLAHQRGASSLSLAVDDQNGPALKLYDALRFTPTAKKVAMIFPMA